MVAPGIRLAGRDDIVAKLALRGLDAGVDLARRHTHLVLGLAGDDRPSRDLLHSLLQDSQRLADLIQSDQVVVVQVAVLPQGDVEVEAIIDAVRLRRAEYRTARLLPAAPGP